MIFNPRQWEALAADIKSNAGNRSPALLSRLIGQFDVLNQARYLAFIDPLTGKLKTWCATFVWDVSLAMGVEIPHWIPNPDQKMAIAVPRIELNANKRNAWLKEEGPGRGWLPSDEAGARAHAAAGCPAVASWFNAMGPGHEAWLVPPRVDAVPATYVAQAGAHNFAYGLLTAGFGSKVRPDFFINS